MDNLREIHKDIYCNNLIGSLMYYDQLIEKESYHLTFLSESNRYFYNAAHSIEVASRDVVDEIEDFYVKQGIIPSFYMDPRTPKELQKTLVLRNYQKEPAQAEHWYQFNLANSIVNPITLLKTPQEQIRIEKIDPWDSLFLDFVQINQLMNGLTPILASKLIHNCRRKVIPGVENHYFIVLSDASLISIGSVGIVGKKAFFAEGATLPEYQRKGIYSFLLREELPC